KVSLVVTGVPLHAWNEETFLLIGDLWGSAVSVDPNTVYKDELEVCRILISTDHRGIINHQCELKVGNFIYPIHCFEEPVIGQASLPFCPPLSSPSFCGKTNEVYVEAANCSHVDESTLSPREQCQVSSPQVEKATYKEALQEVIHSNTKVVSSIGLRGVKHDEPQLEEGQLPPSASIGIRSESQNKVIGGRFRSIVDFSSSWSLLFLSLLAIVASKSCANGRAGQRRRKEGEGRSPNPAGHGRRSSVFGEIIPADKDLTLLALGYSGNGLKPLPNLARGAPDWGYQGKSVNLTLHSPGTDSLI
ncbi:hypothetical protein U1Q18_004181, partial [Sarracenia purpurea var. burkii]